MDRPALVAFAQDSISRGSKSFRFASRLFDRTTRERVWLLYAWCRKCDDMADGQDHGGTMEAVTDPQARLQSIRELTAMALAGTPTGEPAFDCLGVVARECGLTQRMAEDVIEGFALDAADWWNVTLGALVLEVVDGPADITVELGLVPATTEDLDTGGEPMGIAALDFDEAGAVLACDVTISSDIAYDEATDSTLVLALPRTGRTHQIRVHLEGLGHAIVDDNDRAAAPIGGRSSAPEAGGPGGDLMRLRRDRRIRFVAEDLGGAGVGRDHEPVPVGEDFVVLLRMNAGLTALPELLPNRLETGALLLGEIGA
jgi:hypothetical protein